METNFERALSEIKRGYKVRRLGWNGKGMCVYLADDLSTDGEPIEATLLMVTVTGKRVAWLASQSDLLAEDWIRLED